MDIFRQVGRTGLGKGPILNKTYELIRVSATGRIVAKLWLGLALAVSSASGGEEVRPKLILQITVDGLRADLLTRYGDQFGEGGFRALLENGTVFTNAHYQHANTETIVGHATLATGASPAQHGMVGNVWYDRPSGELAYNIEDPDHPLLPTRTKGIGLAVPHGVETGQPLDRVRLRVENNYHLERSGDIFVAPDPHWFLYEKGPIAVMHGSPWNYDTHVPLAFVGSGISPVRFSREVHPADVAPTLSALLGMTPPAAATGQPLPEILGIPAHSARLIGVFYGLSWPWPWCLRIVDAGIISRRTRAGCLF